MTQQSPPPLFLIGTRFQAMMAKSILKHLNISTYDLVVYYQKDGISPESDLVLSALMRDASNVTKINRKLPTRRQFSALWQAAGWQSRSVFLAQIAMPFILALFRLRPDMRLCTFDEGGYNVAPDGPFHAPPPRRVRRFYDVLDFALFPKGAIHFARRRTQKHYTAFPPEQNVLKSRAERIDIQWASFVQPNEADMARTARRIMVLPCMKDFAGSPQSRDTIMSASRNCDLVVRHPRDEAVPGLVSLQLSSPVEGIISAAAETGTVEVLHYASTIRLTLDGQPNIALVDMRDTGWPRDMPT